MAAAPPPPSSRVRFGPFELTAAGGELTRNGIRVQLPPQAFRLLALLIAARGEVVTREQLHRELWDDGTFVDFERGLNSAVNKLRRALCDSAENPRYVQTMPGRGYRFIGSVWEESDPELPVAELSRSSSEHAAQVAKPVSRVILIAAVGTACSVLLACLAIWWVMERSARPIELRVQQLTTNSGENPILHAVISPDGQYLAYGDRAGIQVRIIRSGESHLLPRPRALNPGDEWFPAAWTPDGTRILATSITAQGATGWNVSVVGGSATVLRDNALLQSVSPDGSLIAFVANGPLSAEENAINRRLMRNSEIWTMAFDGENARRVVSGDNLTYFGSVRWSPDGTRIAYQKFHLADGGLVDYTIEICDLKGGTRSIIVSQLHYAGVSIDHTFPQDFFWLRDGRIIYAVRESPPNIRDFNLWAVTVDANGRKLGSAPRKITNLAGFHMEGLSVTADGTRLVVENSSDQSYVYVGRLEADGKLGDPRHLTPDQRYNTPYAWTSDSKAVVFRSDRTGAFALYKQALEQDVPEMIVNGPGNPGLARVSPDGGWLIYDLLLNGRRDYRLMRIPIAGGQPQVILESIQVDNFDCPRRPGAPCVICESRGNEDIFSTVDPLSGARHEAFRVVRSTLNWRLSSDGSQIAMIRDSQPGGIEVRSLTGQIKTRIQVKGWPNPFTVDWAADDKTLFVSHAGLMASPSGPIGATILRVDFQGKAQPLWETRSARYAWGIPSPDGKYLAIRGATTERNAWMIENF
jgi:DNA-binding winged helix-turn-helix (wHTH) protein/Tol biopolymer transport system component